MGSNGKHGAGKGDKYRPVDSKVWSENWDMIFTIESLYNNTLN